MGKRTHLDIGQRTEAVLALLRREEPAALIARRHGIAEATSAPAPGPGAGEDPFS